MMSSCDALERGRRGSDGRAIVSTHINDLENAQRHSIRNVEAEIRLQCFDGFRYPYEFHYEEMCIKNRRGIATGSGALLMGLQRRGKARSKYFYPHTRSARAGCRSHNP
eukprot:IDg1001t1